MRGTTPKGKAIAGSFRKALDTRNIKKALTDCIRRKAIGQGPAPFPLSLIIENDSFSQPSDIGFKIQYDSRDRRKQDLPEADPI